MHITIQSLLDKWKALKWEYILRYENEECNVRLGVFPDGHTKAKFVEAIGIDELDSMVLADYRAEQLLLEWNNFKKEVKDMGDRRCSL